MFNIYVGNLPFSTNEEDLKRLFEPYGDIHVVTILTDRETGKSRGFGFVEMSDDAQGRAAVDGLNGREFEGRDLKIDEARPRQPR